MSKTLNNKYVSEGHNTDSIYYIGELYLSDVGECEVQIYNKEDDHIPHMHIFNKDKTFNSCICIYESKYYDHKNEFEINKFNNKQKEIFNEWINSVNLSNFATCVTHWTNWQYAIFSWNITNPNCKYNKIIEYRGGIDYANL